MANNSLHFSVACRTENLQLKHRAQCNWLTSWITRITKCKQWCSVALPLSMNAIFIDDEFSVSLSLSLPHSLTLVCAIVEAAVPIHIVRGRLSLQLRMWEKKNFSSHLTNATLFFSPAISVHFTHCIARCCPFFGRKLCALDDSSISCTLAPSTSYELHQAPPAHAHRQREWIQEDGTWQTLALVFLFHVKMAWNLIWLRKCNKLLIQLCATESSLCFDKRCNAMWWHVN